MTTMTIPTVRGVSYEEKRDRWRCYHRRFGKPTLQLRFESNTMLFGRRLNYVPMKARFLS